MTNRPEFHLQRILSDGTSQPPEVYKIHELHTDFYTNRRSVLGAGLTVASMFSLLGGCNSEPEARISNAEVIHSPTEKTRILAHRGRVIRMAISPDSTTLASTAVDPDRRGASEFVKLWSLSSGKLLKRIDGGASAITFSPVDSLLVLGRGKGINFLSCDTGAEIERCPNIHGTSIGRIAFSPDGSLMAAATGGYPRDRQSHYSYKESTREGMAKYKVSLYSDDSKVDTLYGHYNVVTDIAVTPDGSILASIDADGRLILRSLPDGKKLKEIHLHMFPRRLAVSPNGESIAVGGVTGLPVIKILSLPEGKLITTIRGPEASDKLVSGGTLLWLSYLPDGETLVSATSVEINMASAIDGEVIRRIRTDVESVALAPNGKLICSGDENGIIRMWELPSGKFIGYLFDPLENDGSASSYDVVDSQTGQTLTYTLPCGTPIPPDAICTCNCVPGTYKPRRRRGTTICTCDTVCTCVPVKTRG